MLMTVLMAGTPGLLQLIDGPTAVALLILLTWVALLHLTTEGLLAPARSHRPHRHHILHQQIGHRFEMSLLVLMALLIILLAWVALLILWAWMELLIPLLLRHGPARAHRPHRPHRHLEMNKALRHLQE